MELVKTSEVYTVKDSTELWNVNGAVTKENKQIRINFSISTLYTGEFLGNFAYTVNDKNDINVSFDCDKQIDEVLFTYGNKLADSIIQELSN